MICTVFQENCMKLYTMPRVHHMLQRLLKNLSQRKPNMITPGGIDHGTWSILVHMYPQRDVPVFQISIDAYAPPEVHYKTGRELRSLREQGVLIFGTGNIVHNLRLVDWHMGSKGFDWAYEFDEYIYQNIINKNYDNILKYKEMCCAAKYAVPSPDHFYPLLYALGATYEEDKVSVFNKSCELGSLTMTGYLWES